MARSIETNVTEEDVRLEGSLRPQTLKEYIGQEKAKESLQIYIDAAKSRGESLDHVLFYELVLDWERRHWRGLLPTRWELI